MSLLCAGIPGFFHFNQRRGYITKILEELWYGNIRPNEKPLMSDKQHEIIKYIDRHEGTLMPMLSEQAKEIYEKLRDNRYELSMLAECEAFISGFSLGARIMLEVIEGTDSEQD